MRPLRILPCMLLATPAAADPRCAALGQPAYTAERAITEGGAPPVIAQVTLHGPRLRIEAPAPAGDRLVTLVTPDLHAVFLTRANPPVALRIPPPAPPAIPPGEHRTRQERAPGGIAIITELRGASGAWHEVERSLCRRDGVLLEARQWKPGEAGGTIVTTRQTGVRMISADPALFQVPAGFRLIEAPAAPISRRTDRLPG